MKAWVKLYTEILDDPKVGTLSWAHRGVWMSLLALAGKLDDRDGDEQETGRLDTLENIAWHLRMPVAELEEAMAVLEARGMVDQRDGVWYVTNYAKRQSRGPSNTRDAIRHRVRRFRQKARSPIFERDNWTCRYCGRKLSLEECTIDHVIPLVKGGTEEPDNLVTACHRCNMIKNSRTPEEAGMTLLPLHGDNISPCNADTLRPDTDIEKNREEKRREDIYDDDNGPPPANSPDDPPDDPLDAVSPALVLFAEARGGLVTSIDAEEIGALAAECEKFRLKLPRGSPGADVPGETWVCEAIREANNARTGPLTLNFVRAILDRWRSEGFKSKRARASPDPPGNRSISAEERRRRSLEVLDGKRKGSP